MRTLSAEFTRQFRYAVWAFMGNAQKGLFRGIRKAQRFPPAWGGPSMSHLGRSPVFQGTPVQQSSMARHYCDSLILGFIEADYSIQPRPSKQTSEVDARTD